MTVRKLLHRSCWTELTCQGNRHLYLVFLVDVTAASSREDRSMLVPESRSSAWNGVLDVEIEDHAVVKLVSESLPVKLELTSPKAGNGLLSSVRTDFPSLAIQFTDELEH